MTLLEFAGYLTAQLILVGVPSFAALLACFWLFEKWTDR